MNAILGYAQLMLRDPNLGSDAKQNLKIIGRSGEHLLGLINEMKQPASASALQELADKYEYDALTQLLEEVCRR
jgi:two-component system, sensor histidine kinase and response regulator